MVSRKAGRSGGWAKADLFTGFHYNPAHDLSTVGVSRSLPVYFGNVQVAGGAHFYRPIQRFSGQINLKGRSILAFQRQYKLDEQQTRQMVWMMAGNQYLVETLHWNTQFGSASSH